MSVANWLAQATRRSPWPQARVLVAGCGSAGFASADALLELGAQVSVIDSGSSEALEDKANLLRELGAQVELGASAADWSGVADLVIASPGWHPDAAVFERATAAGIPIWGDVELAWRLMQPDRTRPWLGITGTNGKTTTTQMLAAMLSAAGLRVATVGNIGRPIIEALNDTIDYDVFVVELSSFQLHWVHSVELHSAAVLNVHPDHLEWYRALASDDAGALAAYTADKAKIFNQVHRSCVYNVAEPVTEQLVAAADVVEGARAIGFTSGIPGRSMVGVVDDLIVDRAFIEQRATSALPLANLTDVHPYAPHNVSNALAAAALARSFGVPASAVGAGLRDFQGGAHRISTVASASGITWVDDSKATNAHAASASLSAFPSVVWIAGGQAKGQHFEDLIAHHATRLRGVVLLGTDADVLAAALDQVAPQVPYVKVAGTTPAIMTEVVDRAGALAQPGDTVLLAPACASYDMWSGGYAARGDDYAAAVRTRLGIDHLAEGE